MRGRLGVLLAAALLAGCLPELPEGKKNPWAVKPPKTPTDIRKIPHTFSLSLTSGRTAESVRLDALATGQVRTRGETVSSMKSWHAKLKLDAPAFVVRHSSAGVVLFGTGLSPDPARRPENLLSVVEQRPWTYARKKGQDAVSQLAAMGIAAEDVRWVLLSSLEPEQAGMVEAFPEASVVVSRREWEWRKGKLKPADKGYALSPEALEAALGPRLKLVDLSDKPAFGPFENGLDLFADGALILVALPGRTPGTLGLWANLDDGPLLMTGSAAYVLDNYLDLALPVQGRFDDLEEYWRSLQCIKAAMRGVPRLTVVPGNDLTPLRLSGRKDIPIHVRK
ncbi:MBL fold metallo-hydrolase [bacterium]|nr:MAG: MBL fold metallo-hydrolase [bacterium]